MGISSAGALKAWATRRANAEKRSLAAKKAHETRRANKRSEAANKAWATRRANQSK
jgi:hypothetical protein